MEHNRNTREPACCLPTDTAEKVALLMKAEDAALIAVVNNYQAKTLVGVISDRDLALKIVGEGRDASTTPVAEIMSRGIVILRTEEFVGASESVAERPLRSIAVGDKNAGVQIIAQSDLARFAGPQKHNASDH